MDGVNLLLPLYPLPPSFVGGNSSVVAGDLQHRRWPAHCLTLLRDIFIVPLLLKDVPTPESYKQ